MNPFKQQSALEIEKTFAAALDTSVRIRISIRELTYIGEDDGLARQSANARKGARFSVICSPDSDGPDRGTDILKERSFRSIERSASKGFSKLLGTRTKVLIRGFNTLDSSGRARIKVDAVCEVSVSPLLKLIETACEKKWCWKIGCTTCGCGELRTAIHRLANDSSRYQSTTTGQLSRDEIARPLEPSAARSLLSKIATLDVALVHQRCAFPNWLGVLGMTLWMTEKIEREERIASLDLVRSFKKLVQGDPQSVRWLENLERENGVLTWRDLERIEFGIGRAETQ